MSETLATKYNNLHNPSEEVVDMITAEFECENLFYWDLVTGKRRQGGLECDCDNDYYIRVIEPIHICEY